jgi:hypothetical protein
MKRIIHFELYNVYLIFVLNTVLFALCCLTFAVYTICLSWVYELRNNLLSYSVKTWLQIYIRKLEMLKPTTATSVLCGSYIR